MKHRKASLQLVKRRKRKMQIAEVIKTVKENARTNNGMEIFSRYSAMYHSLFDAIDDGDDNRAAFFARVLAQYVRKENL